jgi:Uma2 family endonuclease
LCPIPTEAAHGVRWLWLIDPTVERLQVYENGDSSWKLMNEFNADESISALPFADVALQPPWS